MLITNDIIVVMSLGLSGSVLLLMFVIIVVMLTNPECEILDVWRRRQSRQLTKSRYACPINLFIQK